MFQWKRVSGDGDIDGFDDVAPVAARVPEWLQQLAFSQAIEGAALDGGFPRFPGRPGRGPLAEGVFAVVLAQIGWLPAPPVVKGDTAQQGGNTAPDRCKRLAWPPPTRGLKKPRLLPEH